MMLMEIQSAGFLVAKKMIYVIQVDRLQLIYYMELINHLFMLTLLMFRVVRQYLVILRPMSIRIAFGE